MQNIIPTNATADMKNTIPSITIGLDLGDKKHAICVLNAAGEVVEERFITNHKESLRRLSQKYPNSRIALEVGTHSPWTSRFLKGLGHEVLVANPRKLRAIYTSVRKCDQSDAHMIARLARVDPILLSPIEHSTEEQQRDLLQLKLRDNLVRQRVDIISSIRFTLKSLGITVSSPDTARFAKSCRKELEPQHAAVLAMCEPSLSCRRGTHPQHPRTGAAHRGTVRQRLSGNRLCPPDHRRGRDYRAELRADHRGPRPFPILPRCRGLSRAGAQARPIG